MVSLRRNIARNQGDMKDFPKPMWKPERLVSIDWTLNKLREYIPKRPFVVFAQGTCVLWTAKFKLDKAECLKVLQGVVRTYPDFKVKRHPAGLIMITFKSGVGSIVPLEQLQQNFKILREAAYSQGKLPSEIIQSEATNGEDLDLVAGLYARALLYQDAESPEIVHVFE